MNFNNILETIARNKPAVAAIMVVAAVAIHAIVEVEKSNEK